MNEGMTINATPRLGVRGVEITYRELPHATAQRDRLPELEARVARLERHSLWFWLRQAWLWVERRLHVWTS